MLKFNRILLASDFSPNAEAALNYAATLARQFHAELQILHVINTRVNTLPRWRDIFQASEVFNDKTVLENEAFASLLAHPALAGITVDSIVSQGKPGERIIDLALQADLVVMGTPADTNSEGNTACQVAHGCSTPVLLIPGGNNRTGQPQAGAQRINLQRILLALHIAHDVPQAIQLARALAQSYNACLNVLQAVDPDRVASYDLDTGSGLHHNRAAVNILLQKRLFDLFPDDPTGVQIERSVLEGQAAAVILQQSKAQQADLIVMGAHPYGRLHKYFTVSTLDEVVGKTPCPVLAVPTRHSVPLTTSGNGSGSAD